MKIAIIGSGISGLGCAYLLSQKHDITLFEKNSYLGGHARTINIEINEQEVPVDTGFIVFNKKNYPNLTGLFKFLNIDVTKSNMSFGISVDNGLEYSTASISSLFAERKNIFNIHYIKMLKDILKFNKKAEQVLHSSNQNLTISELIEQLKLGMWFKNYYLLPMCGAIWSTPASKIENFPADTLVQFFKNHGLLTVSNQPQWYSVKKGSKEYIKKLINQISGKTTIFTNSMIQKVIRENNAVTIIDSQSNRLHFDQVILACHSDEALNILDRPTKEETMYLSNINYQPNKITVHRDDSFMPANKKAWASWIYRSSDYKDLMSPIGLTYWMNNLQNLNTDANIFVSLNTNKKPRDELTYDQYEFSHPLINSEAIKAQNNIQNIQGLNNTWYCGAWLGYGFHEDGLKSAVEIAKKLKVDIPWFKHPA